MPNHCGLVGGRARKVALVALAAALLRALAGSAQAEGKDPLAIVEFGGAGDWGLNSGGSSFGPTAGFEFTPIKNWLEVETSVSSLLDRRQTEWGAELVFKKPFDLSPTLEFEPGIGSEWIHTTSARSTTDELAAIAAMEFMFWQTPEKRLGWFFEPSFSYALGGDHDRSLGASAGVLIALP